MNTCQFAFDVEKHQYLDLVTGEILPHVTGLLDAAGLTNPRFYTEEARVRGSEVHRMTTAYDLGAIERPLATDSPYKGWLLAHIAAMRVLRPSWSMIEEALVHPELRFGGRPDRAGTLQGVVSVVDLKSGGPEPKAHPVQTALQAILLAPEVKIPAEHIDRYCLYLKRDGKWKLTKHEARRDFAVARDLLRQFGSSQEAA
jgi:hypothetical protein